MRKLRAELYNKRLDLVTDIELPATAEEIMDALEQVRDYKGKSNIASLYDFKGVSDFLSEREVKPCSLYELNYFVEMFSEMDTSEVRQLEGLVKAEFPVKKDLKTSDLINLIMHLKQGEVMNIDAINDHDLGKFYVDNEFISEITNDTPKWLIDNLNYTKIGKEMRESEHGQYVKDGYVVDTAIEIKSRYKGNYAKPIPADYIFKLEIAKAPINDAPNDEITVELKLPTTDEKLRNTISETGATSLTDCVFYEFFSTIPKLENILTDMINIEELNRLAINIEGLKEFNDITKYKALLSTIGESELTLSAAFEVCDYLHEFYMEYTITTPTEYAQFKLKDIDVSMKDELIDFLDKDNYGEALMTNDGVEITPYGMLIPFEGMTLKEQMEKTEREIKMGGISQ